MLRFGIWRRTSTVPPKRCIYLIQRKQPEVHIGSKPEHLEEVIVPCTDMLDLVPAINLFPKLTVEVGRNTGRIAIAMMWGSPSCNGQRFDHED